jgi:hypothetical protein
MDRFTWFVVGGVLGLIVVGLASATILRGREGLPDLSTPRGVALAYELAEQRGDGETAWNLLAASTQAPASHARFISRVGSFGSDRDYLTTEDERIDADTASVVLVRTSPGSGGIFGSASYTTRNTVRLARQGTDWRITVPPDANQLFDSKP